VILGFRRKVDENYAFLGYYATSIGNLLPTFQENLSVPFSGVNNSKKVHPLITKLKLYRLIHLAQNFEI
jgi:hypothetical protein